MKSKKGRIINDTIRINGVDYIIKFTQSGMHEDNEHMELLLRCKSVKTLKEMEEDAIE